LERISNGTVDSYRELHDEKQLRVATLRYWYYGFSAWFRAI